MPRRVAAYASAAPWLPEEWVITPCFASSAVRQNTAFAAPRALKAPIFWKFSHLKKSCAPVSASSVLEVSTGVRSTCSRIRACASRMAARSGSVATSGLKLRALVEAGQHEFAVAQRLGSRQPSVRRAKHHVEKLVAGFAHRDIALKQPRDVDVNVLAHRAHRAWVGAQLDDGQDRIADDIALSRREKVHDVPRSRAQRHHLGGGRRAVHEPQPRGCRRLGLVENTVDSA